MPPYAYSHLRTCLRLSGAAAVTARSRTAASSLSPIRHASLTSAIDRGIRKSRNVESPAFANRDRRSEREDTRRPERENFRRRNRRDDEQRESKDVEFDEDEFIRSGNFRALPREYQAPRVSRFRGTENSYGNKPPPNRRTYEEDRFSASKDKGRRQKENERDKGKYEPREPRYTDSRPERVKAHVKIPSAIPYTTPASEFIYGTTSVEACLRCSRRQLYKLYIYQSVDEELSQTKITLRKLALSRGVPVKMAFGDWDRLLDKMSAGRPHNGVILEASPIPRLPVTSLDAVTSSETDHFTVSLAPQSREEAAVNGTDNRVSKISPIQSLSQTQTSNSYPLTLLLDGILDPGNLGAILRSAYYLGVSAVCFTGRNSAPLSPVTIKASAGAAENMTLLKVNNAVDFIKRSRENGWRFYAADAPGPGTAMSSNVLADGSGAGTLLRQAPSVLMLGSEGTGLSPHVKAHADSFVGIPGARLGLEGDLTADPARVDSLNVSVAAALLIEMFMRTPLVVSEARRK
ncbi:hypothetical protein PVAR5_4252 [Paecilomyces variotii No. 5]|uniref:rRNA methyltransferase 1, mitochondrial n=1 Tax=Byssochlamys spectabilis (strain No. 5 / NBRC 109023) TaxID=1356009 RepID=V5G0S2_BYSSN|nr:hypothetical protein PVAR5_4252 [Paecilomyces variotii No. 5]